MEIVILLMIHLVGRIFVRNKAEDVNLNVFNMINEAKLLMKHILCDCKCKHLMVANVIQIKSRTKKC